MTVAATEAVGATSAAGLAGVLGPTTTSSSSEDKDMFLQLMVAQLRYQDPMNPADPGEFLSQNAQFTALEKMQSVADQTGMVLGAQMAFGASGLIGQPVSYTRADGTTGTGTVRGVTFDASGPLLDVDGTSVPLVDVLTVGSTTPPTGTGGATDTSDTSGASDTTDTSTDGGTLGPGR